MDKFTTTDDVYAIVLSLIRQVAGGNTTGIANMTGLLEFTTASSFTQPDSGNTVAVQLSPADAAEISLLTAGQDVYVVGGGRYTFDSAAGDTVTLTNTGDVLNAAALATVPAGGLATAVNLQPTTATEVLVSPLGGGANDWPNVISLLRDAAPAGKVLTLAPGTFNFAGGTLINTDLSLCDRSRIEFSPETNLSIPAPGSTATEICPFLITESGPTWDLVFAGVFPSTAEGADTVALTYAGGPPVPVVGQWMTMTSPEQPANGNTWWYQRKATAVTLTSGTAGQPGSTYNITLDRGLPRDYTFTAQAPGAVPPPGNQIYLGQLSSEGISINGNWATVSASSPVLGILNGRDMDISRFRVVALPATITGAITLFTFFGGCYASKLHDLDIDLTGVLGVPTVNGVLLESTEDCTAERVRVTGAANAFILNDAIETGLLDCEGNNGGTGVIFGTNDGTVAYDGSDGCINCYVKDSTFNGNSGTGVTEDVTPLTGIISKFLLLDNVTTNYNGNGVIVNSPNAKILNHKAKGNTNGIIIYPTATGADITGADIVGNVSNGLQNAALNATGDRVYIERTVNTQIGMVCNGGSSITLNNFRSHDTFTGIDSSGTSIQVSGVLKVRGGTIDGIGGGGGNGLPGSGAYVTGLLDLEDTTIVAASFGVLTLSANATVRLRRCNITAAYGLGLTAGSTVWVDAETTFTTTNFQNISPVSYISRPIQTAAGVYTNTAALIGGAWAVPWPQVTGDNSVQVTPRVLAGTPGDLSVVYPVTGELSVSSASFAVSGKSLTVTPSAGGGSASTINFAANQTAAQACAALNAQFASSGTKAVASIAGDGTFMYVAASVAGVTLAMTGTAAATFAFTATVGFTVQSSSSTDTSTVSYIIS